MDTLQDDYRESDADDDDPDGDGGKLSEEFVASQHFGGFVQKSGQRGDADEGGDDGDESGGVRRKSKQEVYAELIAKSKMHKVRRQRLGGEAADVPICLFEMQRQRARDENTELQEQLDREYHMIAGSLVMRDRDAERAAFAEQRRKLLQQQREHTVTAVPAEVAADVAFDQMVKELSFDVKAHATDRTKTPDELAREAHDRLRLLERARLARMRDEAVPALAGGGAAGAAGSSAKSGDDLDDAYFAELNALDRADGDSLEMGQRTTMTTPPTTTPTMATRAA